VKFLGWEGEGEEQLVLIERGGQEGVSWIVPTEEVGWKYLRDFEGNESQVLVIWGWVLGLGNTSCRVSELGEVGLLEGPELLQKIGMEMILSWLGS
jgi:hypothetical protein